MKIAYLGNTKYEWCTEQQITQTLEKFGYEVSNLQEDEVKIQKVIDTANSSDLFMWTRTPDFLKGDSWKMLAKIRVPTISYHLDLYMGISRETVIEDDPFFFTDIVFQPDGDPESLKKFKKLGVNAYWFPPAVLKDECYLTKSNKDMRCDVAFIGASTYHKEWEYRTSLINFLEYTYKDRFRLIPSEDHKFKMGDDLNKQLSSIKVCVGDSLCKDFKHTNYWSNRIVEQTGRGGFVIFPRIKGLEQFYKDKVHVVYYKYEDFTQLRKLIDYYLEHDKEREKIRKAGHARTKKYNTFDNRLSKMFHILDDQGIT